MKVNWLGRTACKELPYYTLVTSQKDLNKTLKRLKIDEPCQYISKNAHTTTHFFTKEGKDTVAIVCLDLESIKERPLHELIGMLAHEGMHIWQEYMEGMGETKPSHEFGAYCMQYILMCLTSETLKIRDKANGRKTGRK